MMGLISAPATSQLNDLLAVIANPDAAKACLQEIVAAANEAEAKIESARIASAELDTKRTEIERDCADRLAKVAHIETQTSVALEARKAAADRREAELDAREADLTARSVVVAEKEGMIDRKLSAIHAAAIA